jgi:hypothetical protein
METMRRLFTALLGVGLSAPPWDAITSPVSATATGGRTTATRTGPTVVLPTLLPPPLLPSEGLHPLR